MTNLKSNWRPGERYTADAANAVASKVNDQEERIAAVESGAVLVIENAISDANIPGQVTEAVSGQVPPAVDAAIAAEDIHGQVINAVSSDGAVTAAAVTAVSNAIAGRNIPDAITRFPTGVAGGFVGDNGYGTDLLYDAYGNVIDSSIIRWLTRLKNLGLTPEIVQSFWYGAGFVGENGRATELVTDVNGLVPLDVLQAQAARVGALVGAARRLDVGLTPYGFPRDYMANEWYLRWTRMLTRKLMLGDASTQFDIAIIGDSYSFATQRWTGPFWQSMKTQFGDAGIGWVAFSSLSGIGLDNASVRSDTAMTVSGSWTAAYYGNLSPDLGRVSSSTVGDTITVTFPAGQTSAKLYFIGGASGSAITYAWNGNGAGATTLSTTAANALQIATLAGIGSTSTTLTITVTGGTVTLCGVDIRKSSNGVRVHKISATGSDSAEWASVNTASWNSGLASIAPQLVILMLGANDQGAGRSVSQYTANMQTIISNIRNALGSTAVDIAVVMQPENQRGLPILMSDYASAMQPVADTNKCAFLDTQYLFGDTPANYAYGSARPWFASDNLHPDPLTGGRVLTDGISRMVLGR